MPARADLHALLSNPEDRHLEFKSAARGFHFDELVRYCVALANEGGGTIILGVTDKRPRQVVGTRAFEEPGRTEAGLFEQLHQRISVEECRVEGKRVLLIHVPARATGSAWQYRGAFWMRAGDALVPMSDEQLRRIHAEALPDYSAEACPGAGRDDLDPGAIDTLRTLWQRRSPRGDFAQRSQEQLLSDAELLEGGQVTRAALILLGRREALGRYLAHAEIIFEYRPDEIPGPAAERHEFRCGFLPVLDEIWRLVNLRNDLQHYQQRFVMRHVPTFNERAVREAVLNAVSHRDYRDGGSIFIRQFPRRIEIVSPGGLPQGITPENILRKQNPRNRRIAEMLARCGLVERAGQGFDLIYRECIRQSKRLPDFTHTDGSTVWVTLHGEVQDPEFLRFLAEVGEEQTASFDTDDFLLIDLAHREEVVPAHLKPRVARLLDMGIVERIGRGRGARLILSRRFHRFLGHAGAYTRRRGLDRGTNKMLLLRHIQDAGPAGTGFIELAEVLPGLSRRQIQGLASDLRSEGRITMRGTRRGARWFVVQDDDPSASTT